MHLLGSVCPAEFINKNLSCRQGQLEIERTHHENPHRLFHCLFPFHFVTSLLVACGEFCFSFAIIVANLVPDRVIFACFSPVCQGLAKE
jgi:hypothetical protein